MRSTLARQRESPKRRCFIRRDVPIDDTGSDRLRLTMAGRLRRAGRGRWHEHHGTRVTGRELDLTGRPGIGDFAESRTALASAPPASGELTLETAPVVRSDCALTLRATGHKEWPAAALLASFGAVSD